MVGKDCVAIASDTRYGIQQQTVGLNFQRVFAMNDRVYVGLPGLATDVLTVYVGSIACEGWYSCVSLWI